jgi:hypothetical protein
MNDLVTGIIHVHSDFSRDGLCSIADLAEFAREAGFQFVGLTDHAEDLSVVDMKNLQQECERNSDESLVLIPGLEFRCTGDFHILGLGVTCHISSEDPLRVAHQIGRMGGLAVLAHPGRSGYLCPQELRGVLNGIEIWNAAYDGRFVPPLAGFHLLQQARSSNSAISGFGGADLHGLFRPPGVVVQLQVNGNTRIHAPMILDCLRSGKFIVRGKYVSFDAQTGPHPLLHPFLWAFRKVYEHFKAVRNLALGEV